MCQIQMNNEAASLILFLRRLIAAVFAATVTVAAADMLAALFASHD